MRTHEVKELLDCVARTWPHPENTPKLTITSDGRLLLVMYEQVGDSYVERSLLLEELVVDIPIKAVLEGITHALAENKTT